MTNFKHTPGPWTVNAWPQRHDEIRIGAVGTPLICAIMVRDVSINEQKANARLIAAAPELLEALKVACGALYDAAHHINQKDDIAAATYAVAQKTYSLILLTEGKI